MNDDNGFLKSARDLSAILAIYLYFAGWMYIYHYYNFFGLSIKQVDIDLYYFIVYSVNVVLYLLHHWFYLSLILLAALILTRGVKKKWGIYAASFMMFVVIYYSAFYAGRDAAKANFIYEGSSLKTIRFVIKKESEPGKSDYMSLAAKQQPDKSQSKDSIKNGSTELPDATMGEFISYNKLNALRLLASTKDEYFVLVADTSVNEKTVDRKPVKVYMIKKENINLIKLDN